MCVACRQTDGKRALIRLVRTADGVVFDPSGKVAGRGAYIHPEAGCWQKILDSQILQRSLRSEISPGNWEALTAAIAALLGESEERPENQIKK